MVMFGPLLIIIITISILIVQVAIGYGLMNMGGYGLPIMNGDGQHFTMVGGSMILFTDGYGNQDMSGRLRG
jgi:hypothetical protein